MIIILRANNVTFLGGNRCVYEFLNRLVREKNSLVWVLLGQDDEAFVHAVEQLRILFILCAHLPMQLRDVHDYDGQERCQQE